MSEIGPTPNTTPRSDAIRCLKQKLKLVSEEMKMKEELTAEIMVLGKKLQESVKIVEDMNKNFAQLPDFRKKKAIVKQANLAAVAEIKKREKRIDELNYENNLKKISIKNYIDQIQKGLAGIEAALVATADGKYGKDDVADDNGIENPNDNGNADEGNEKEEAEAVP